MRSNSEDDVEILSWGTGKYDDPLPAKDLKRVMGKQMAKALKVKKPEKPTLDGIHFVVADGSILDMRMEENQDFAIKTDQFKLLEDYYSGPFHPRSRMVYARRRIGNIYFRDITDTTQWGILMRSGITSDNQVCMHPQIQGKQTLTSIFFDQRIGVLDVVDSMCNVFDHIPDLTYRVSSDLGVFTIDTSRKITEKEYNQYIKIDN